MAVAALLACFGKTECAYTRMQLFISAHVSTGITACIYAYDVSLVRSIDTYSSGNITMVMEHWWYV